MSVNTAADDARFAYRKLVDQLQVTRSVPEEMEHHLERITDPSVTGGTSWTPEYRKEVKKELRKVRKIRKLMAKLNPDL